MLKLLVISNPSSPFCEVKKKGSLLTKPDRRTQDAKVWKQAIRAITLSKTRTATLLKRGRKKGSLLTKSDRQTQDAKVWKQAIRAITLSKTRTETLLKRGRKKGLTFDQVSWKNSRSKGMEASHPGTSCIESLWFIPIRSMNFSESMDLSGSMNLSGSIILSNRSIILSRSINFSQSIDMSNVYYFEQKLYDFEQTSSILSQSLLF